MTTNYITTEKREGIILHSLENIKDQYEVLPAGVYNLKDYSTMMAEIPAFVQAQLPDNLVHFKTGVFGKTQEILNSFFAEKTVELYKELGLGHKVGMIFHGKPGTGKTSLCHLIMESLAKESNAICLIATNFSIGFIERTVKKIRTFQNNPICIFIDEIDESIRMEEKYYLTFLDGSDSFTNVSIIGCTNHLEKIPDRIKHRKSRIKYLFEVNSLPDTVYFDYLKSKIGNKWSAEIAKFVHYASENKLTIDQLKHAVTDFVIEGKSIEKACEEVTKY